MKLGRSVESRQLKKAISDDREKADRLQELGEKFERDKEKIETQITKVENSRQTHSSLRDHQHVGRFLPPDAQKIYPRLSGTVCGENHRYTLWRILVCFT